MNNPKTESLLSTLETFLLGKRRKLEYALTCLLSQGHILIEDVPGVGKTTLAKSVANCINADFKRIQFTSDLLPSDLIGVTVFHQNKGQFEFQKGPVFTNVLLADEINRANPKTQSALLEAMHDAQVSHDGKTMPLPSPFFVIATQNSKDNYGTFPLPESQLDRFLMKIHLGYPDEVHEKNVIKGHYQKDFNNTVKISQSELAQLQTETRAVHVSDELLHYMYQIIDSSRNHPNVRVGVSPRGGQALYRACQSMAFIRNRDYVIPDDVSELTPYVLGHRVILKHHQVPGTPASENAVTKTFDEILDKVARPV